MSTLKRIKETLGSPSFQRFETEDKARDWMWKRLDYRERMKHRVVDFGTVWVVTGVWEAKNAREAGFPMSR